MLMVLTQIKPSTIHGLGLFAVHKIPKGSLIWKYQEPIDYRLTDVPNNMIEFRDKYAYIPKGKTYWEFPGDAAIFMNHSINPNVIYHDEEDMIASCDILADSELLCNYFEFDEKPESGGKL